MNNPEDLLSSYKNGQHVQVWEKLRELGSSVRDPKYLGQARAVAHETMQRVRINVEIVHRQLIDLGYKFQYPEQAFIPPHLHAWSILNDVEKVLGILPLSLEAFYVEVGSVNFMQSEHQLIQYQEPERESAPELALLGEEDPLVVDPVSELAAQLSINPHKRKFDFAPDEFHKSYYSGGENYHALLPNPAADFRIKGMYDIDEYFVDYLRATFQYGGFRGRMDSSVMDRGKKDPPNLRIIQELGKGLLPF